MDTQTQTEQAPAASVEDRIANIFGGAPKQAPPDEAAQEEPTATDEVQAASEEPTDETAAPAEETFEVEIDGEKFQLPKKLEKAVMQERDYTQKSQTLADQRRQIEHQQQQQRIQALSTEFEKATAQEREDLSMIDKVISQASTQDITGWDLDKLIRHRMDLDNLKERKAALEQTVNGKRQEFGQKQAQEIAKLRAESLDAIKKRVPGWGEATAKEIREHARSEGYSDAELDAILDPRHAVTLWKAQQFDKLKASAQKTVSTVKNVKTTPTNPMPQKVKDTLTFRRDVAKLPPGSAKQQALVKDRIAKLFG